MPSHRNIKENSHAAPKPSKKQERLNAHEQKQRRNILIAAAIFGGVILIILAIGLVDGVILTPNKVVASVGEEEILVKDYQAKARFTRWQLIQQVTQLQNYAQIYAQYGMDTTQTESTINYYNTLLNSDELLADAVMEAMIEEIIITRKAEELGISVSDTEVQGAVESDFGYYPNGTPTAAVVATTEALPTLNAEQLLMVTATPTSEPTAEVVEEETDDAMEDEEPAPTATPYTAELLEENYAEYLGKIASAEVTEEEFMAAQKYNLLRDKVYEAITADAPLATEEQVWARHILVEDVTEVDSILGQLESGGMAFSDLALLYSKDEGSAVNGGDLGWFSRGQMVSEFEEAAFALEVGEISDGVQTEYGYHIIQVIAHEETVSSSSAQDQAKEVIFSQWLTEEREAIEAELVINETLMTNNTPSHPTINDPKVFEAIYGITIKEYRATGNAQIKEATAQVKTLTAQPPLEEATPEPSTEE